jgi:Tol biopolymer transport system component
MKALTSFIITAFFLLQSGYAQVEIFEPGLISDNDAFGIAISPDNKHLFYVKSYGGRDTLRIYTSHRKNGQWHKPVPAFFNNDQYPHIDPSFSPDGKIILYNVSKDSARGFDIYAVYKTKHGWSDPVLLDDAVNSPFSDFYATVAQNKNIYFTRRTSSNDIYVSKYERGRYQKAVPLPSPVNTSGTESNPYISPGEDYLIYFSDKPGGYGESDLYISFQKNGRWSIPQNLGPLINTATAEFCPGIFNNGKYFYFSRTLRQGNKRIENIYRIKTKALNLEKMRQNAQFEP